MMGSIFKSQFTNFQFLSTEYKKRRPFTTVSLLQNLADILLKGAADGGYVNPHKVRDILCVTDTNRAVDEVLSGQYIIA